MLKKVYSSSTDYQPVYRYRRMKNAQSGSDKEHTFEAVSIFCDISQETLLNTLNTGHLCRAALQGT